MTDENIANSKKRVSTLAIAKFIYFTWFLATYANVVWSFSELNYYSLEDIFLQPRVQRWIRIENEKNICVSGDPIFELYEYTVMYHF